MGEEEDVVMTGVFEWCSGERVLLAARHTDRNRRCCYAEAQGSGKLLRALRGR